ncbi:cyclin-O [Hippocampus comes]|uniref:G2/mitotic-specific cyclin-B2 n=1 Tax=Hippocampus comes TaxID=109280 RepID=A0A3Q2XW87_HIPCM|nr:PREDICTED: cyclin-O [Hippocampus comes]
MVLVKRGGDGSVRVRVERYRKQKLVSRLSDSGFEDDLAGSPTPHTGAASSPPCVDEPEGDPADQASNWYLQYGDVGYKIQKEREALFYPCKSLALQPQVTAEARCKLVSWLIPVHKHFRLSFECCCLTVNIMDRFLACTPVAADCFQLLGVTALLLASKKVEVCSPSISHLLSLCCDTFTREQLFNLERLILVRLHFRLGAPTLAFFLDYHANHMDAANVPVKRCSSLAQKVCELSLADYSFNKYVPSLTASCALTLALELLQVEHVRCRPEDELQDSTMKDQCGSDHDKADSSLAQECRGNLKLLAALNKESLSGDAFV